MSSSCTHTASQREHMHCPVGLFIFHITPVHTSVSSHSAVQRLLNPKWEVCLLHNNGLNVHLKGACVQWYLCVCAHLTLLSVVSLQRKEHNNWSKLDLAGYKGAVLWTWSYWDSMEYSMHLCWVLKRHNAKLELGVYMHCEWFISLALLKNGCITCNNLYVLEWIDGASAPEERNSDSCQHTSHVCPFEESDELKPGRRTGGLLLYLW